MARAKKATTTKNSSTSVPKKIANTSAPTKKKKAMKLMLPCPKGMKDHVIGQGVTSYTCKRCFLRCVFPQIELLIIFILQAVMHSLITRLCFVVCPQHLRSDMRKYLQTSVRNLFSTKTRCCWVWQWQWTSC